MSTKHDHAYGSDRENAGDEEEEITRHHAKGKEGAPGKGAHDTTETRDAETPSNAG